VTVYYEDHAGSTLHEPLSISGNIGDSYDASTTDYQLTIERYTLDDAYLPENLTGTLSETAQEVHYIYKKETVETTGDLQPEDYEIGQTTITGKYTGEIIKGKLTVNVHVVSQGGTFADGIFTYYCARKIKKGDTVILEGYDHEGHLLDTQTISVVVSPGLIEPLDYAIGASTITGSYLGNVKKVQLVISGEVISAGSTFIDNQFSYYVKARTIHEGDEVLLNAFNQTGDLVDTKPLSLIVIEVGTITPDAYKLVPATITGSCQETVEKFQLVVNGDVYW
jgi:hypothetical protein